MQKSYGWQYPGLIQNKDNLEVVFLQDKLYYLEGYVYAPGSKKRDLMREIYSILWSFKI